MKLIVQKRNLLRLFLLIALSWALPLSPGCAQNTSSGITGDTNYVTNGTFDSAGGEALPGWKAKGDVQTESSSGTWKTLTAKFRSGSNKSIAFYFYVLQGSLGSIWIDNLKIDPEVKLANPGFEDVGPSGGLLDWRDNESKGTLFPDSTRASEGKRSLRITHDHEAVPETFILQDIPVEPNREYTFSFDMYVGEDFQGEARGWLFNATHEVSLDFENKNLLASNLVEDRDRLGKSALVISAGVGRPATIEQDISVVPNSNLRASFDLETKSFVGSVILTVEDIASGKELCRIENSKTGEKWSALSAPFQNSASKIRLKIAAMGEGRLRLDNVAVTPPVIVPALQKVRWQPTTSNFKIANRLTVSVQGESRPAIDGGLDLLQKDIKPFGVTLQKTGPDAAIRIFIGSAYKVQGKGDEAYYMTVDSKGVIIKSGGVSGAFYGLMTLLQLVDKIDGKPVFLPCNVTDYPDMPMRGFLYADPEQAARWKMNTLVVSTGYPVEPEKRQALHDLVKKCQSLNLQFIPYFLTLEGGYYVQGINPNLAAGIWVKDEPVTLHGVQPSPLAKPYVIRTALSDVRVMSANGAVVYELGKDYQVVDGDMQPKYDDPNARRFAIARLPGSSIPDGAEVRASYDWVSHRRDTDEVHIAYVPLEPETEKLMSNFLTGLAKEFPFTFIHTSSCLHEFGPADAQLKTDSRVIKSGKKPIQLLVEDTRTQDAAIKRANPNARIFQWAGNVGDYVKAAGPGLPEDAFINIWGYDANWPATYGREAIEYWSKLGHETSAMSWDNLQNIRGWAQVIMEARRKGYPCQGLIGSGFEGRPGGFKETAIVAWKVPGKGESGFVALPAAKRSVAALE